MLPSTFESRRLFARLPSPSDAEGIFNAYACKPEVSRYMIWRPHESVSTTQAFIAECVVAAAAGIRLPYVLFEHQNLQAPIGMLEARPQGHKVDLGYVLAPQFWGRGYMPEAISALATVALSIEVVFRVQAFCDVENLPSQRALAKAGFTREGRHERFMIHPNMDSEPRPCYMYAKCK
jgi:ribosomal-protein-alanine N-acetyltransferase